MTFNLISPGFGTGERIPTKYTCDGADVSPSLQWSDYPQETVSFALICDDPDAPVGTWDHWVIFNLPGRSSALPEAVPPDAELLNGSRQGTNSWGRLGYGGPCPPSGTHRYFFKLYALDTMLDLSAGATSKQLVATMQGHIVGKGETVGLYSRS